MRRPPRPDRVATVMMSRTSSPVDSSRPGPSKAGELAFPGRGAVAAIVRRGDGFVSRGDLPPTRVRSVERTEVVGFVRPGHRAGGLGSFRHDRLGVLGFVREVGRTPARGARVLGSFGRVGGSPRRLGWFGRLRLSPVGFVWSMGFGVDWVRLAGPGGSVLGLFGRLPSASSGMGRTGPNLRYEVFDQRRYGPVEWTPGRRP